MVFGGDLNDNKASTEKKGGKLRSEKSFKQFREFIQGMNMVEIIFLGREWTWANNRTGEGYVEEKLDRFFASPEWMYHNPNAVVTHVQK